MKKKNLLFLAAGGALFALTACSSDETIANNVSVEEANTISFNPAVSNITRAVDANLPTTGFRVTAVRNATPATVYFKNVDFSKTGAPTTYTSTTKYYWPSDYNLDFYAYAPIATEVVGDGKQIVPTSDGSAYDANAYSEFKVTPATAAADQVDLVYARTNNWGKATGASVGHIIPTAEGVTINFRHAESKVLIKLYNSNSNISVTVRDASICNVFTTGVFTLSADNTDNQNSALLASSQWGSQASTGNYTVTAANSAAYNVAVGSAAQVGEDWILIPQTLTYGTTYTGSGVGDGFTGACIKINLKIQNNAGSGTGADAYIVGAASGANDGYITAMWPLKSDPTPIEWVPGKKYTYTIDLAGGGYYESNTAAGTGNALDPILAGAEIKFVTVTVDDWTEEAGNVYTGGTTPVTP